jgi:hypothetical protein
MLQHDMDECVKAAERYCAANAAAVRKAGVLERTPAVDETTFLAELGTAFDTKRSPRPTPESLVLKYAEALNARAKAEEDDAAAKAELADARTNFEKELKLLRSKL